jgi:hypothetical protein
MLSRLCLLWADAECGHNDCTPDEAEAMCTFGNPSTLRNVHQYAHEVLGPSITMRILPHELIVHETQVELHATYMVRYAGSSARL